MFNTKKFFLTPLHLAVYLFAFTAIALTGCSNDDDEPKKEDPTIVVEGGVGYTSANATVVPGTAVKFKMNAAKGVDGKDLEEFKVEYSYDGGATQLQWKKVLNTSSYTLDTTINTRTAEGTERWVFTVTDKSGKSAQRSFTITTKQNNVDTTTKKAPKSYSVAFSSVGPFFTTVTGDRYGAADAQANASKVDITWFYSDVSKNNLISPVGRNNEAYAGANNKITWGSVSTEFRTTSTSSTIFGNLDDEKQLKTIFDAGTPTKVINNPDGIRISGVETSAGVGGQYQAGTIIAFKGADGKYGLLKINTVATDANGGSSLEIKVEN